MPGSSKEGSLRDTQSKAPAAGQTHAVILNTASQDTSQQAAPNSANRKTAKTPGLLPKRPLNLCPGHENGCGKRRSQCPPFLATATSSHGTDTLS